MDIVWDDQKNEWLKRERNVSFEEIEGMLLEGRILDIIDNPVRPDQQYFVVSLRQYTWVVPFIVSKDDQIVLKTAYQSRKYHRLYGGRDGSEIDP